MLQGARDLFDRGHSDTGSKPLLGMCAGLAAGFLATLAMDGFQRLAKQAIASRGDEGAGNDQSSGGDHEEPATLKVSRRIGKRVLHRDLDDSSAQLASEAVHYGYGTLMGGVYGVLAELFPKTATASGAPYGAVLFALGDEVAVPALGLSKRPSEYPLASHAQALGAHLVYGTALDLLRRGIRSCMIEREARRALPAGDDRPLRAVPWPDRTEFETEAW